MFQPNILDGFDTTDFIARDYEWYMSFNQLPGNKSISLKDGGRFQIEWSYGAYGKILPLLQLQYDSTKGKKIQPSPDPYLSTFDPQ